ncbi:glycosyltransferase [Mesorhizobium koreense]|uniref:glycosyltransferase n=1 Tax=Mesorhizobium koreense TaxID=3074855 RepID=UPI00287BA347|nr:glycosyltransferase [Mesorhizobium sp. WR6]
MIYECVAKDEDYWLDYLSLDMFDVDLFAKKGKIHRLSADEVDEPADGYDFWVFNWHFFTMGSILPIEVLSRLAGPKFCIVLELDPQDPLKLTPKGFDGYIALDPHVERTSRIFPFPRPLEHEPRKPLPSVTDRPPVIGSFGFGTPGKGFELLVELVNREFDRATVRINIPPGTYTHFYAIHDQEYPKHIEAMCRKIAKPGIDIVFSYDFLDTDALVDWCAANDLNCFMYTRQQTGLSATTDQAVASGRPLLTLANDTFRHIHSDIRPYPETGLREALTSTTEGVARLQQNWSRENFRRTFHEMLESFGLPLPASNAAAPRSASPLAPIEVLHVHFDKDEGGDLLSYSHRLSNSLARTGDWRVKTVRIAAPVDLPLLLADTEPDVILFSKADELAPTELMEAVAGVPGAKPVILTDDPARWSGGPFTVLARQPIIPFCTVTSSLRKGPPTIWLVGFGDTRSELENAVLKIASELPEASILIEAVPAQQAGLAARLDALRAQLVDKPSLQLTIQPLPSTGTELIEAVGSTHLTVIHHDPARDAEIESYACLAMITERPVVFARAAKQNYAGKGVIFEQWTMRELLKLGNSAQIKLLADYGEWNLAANIRALCPVSRRKSGSTLRMMPKKVRTAAEILAELDDQAFIHTAYETVLGRAPDPSGTADNLSRLERGEFRGAVLLSIARSPEARQRGVDIPGIPGLAWRMRLLRMPVVRHIFRRTRRGRDHIAQNALRRGTRSDSRSDPTKHPPLTNEDRARNPASAPAAMPRQTVRSSLPQQIGIPLEIVATTRIERTAIDDVFLLLGVHEQFAEGVNERLRHLSTAWAARGRVRPVVWSTVSRKLHRTDIGGAALLDELTLDPSSDGGWLLASKALYADPGGTDLVGVDVVMEAHRLGLRTAFIFEGADALHKQNGHHAAKAHEEYMQALLLADVVLPVSYDAADDLLFVFTQYHFADWGPVIETVVPPPMESRPDAAAWSTYVRLIGGILRRTSDAARRIKAFYYWISPLASPPRLAFAQALGRTLAEMGVRLIPVRWNAETGDIEVAMPAGDDGSIPWSNWVDPLAHDAPKWVLAAADVTTPDLNEARSFMATRGLRLAVIFGDENRPTSQAISGIERTAYEGLAEADKILALSVDRYENLYRFLLSWRGKVHSAENRFKTLPEPTERLGTQRRIMPRRADVGALKCLVWVPAGRPEILTRILDVADKATRQTGTSLSIIVLDALTPDMDDMVGEGSTVTLDWCGGLERENALAEADFVIHAGKFGVNEPDVLDALWKGVPCVVSGCADVEPELGTVNVGFENGNSLFDAVVRIMSPAWRETLSDEAVSRPVRGWLDYARALCEELATDQRNDARQSLGKWNQQPSASLIKLAQRPKLSICLSTYNRAGWLTRNLANIYSQISGERNDLEVLVVDNASQDNTPDVVQAFFDRSNFRFHRNAKNVGMLGNLAVTAQRARGEYVWIIGDDDLTRAGCIATVLDVLHRHPRIGLVYLNYGYTSEANPLGIADLQSFLNAYNVLEPAGPDELSTVKDLAAKNENFYTAIYSHIYRRDHAMRSYCQETSGRPFSSMLTCIPTSHYVLNYMPDEAAYWIGEPSLVVNSNVSWVDYGTLFDLEQLPRAWDLAERNGADQDAVDRRRANRLWLVAMMWKDIFENDRANNSPYFNAARVLMRLKHLPEIDAYVPEMRRIYAKAHEVGHPAAGMPPSELFSAFPIPCP